jgi:hypothetical protein
MVMGRLYDGCMTTSIMVAVVWLNGCADFAASPTPIRAVLRRNGLPLRSGMGH